MTTQEMVLVALIVLLSAFIAFWFMEASRKMGFKRGYIKGIFDSYFLLRAAQALLQEARKHFTDSAWEKRPQAYRDLEHAINQTKLILMLKETDALIAKAEKDQ